MLRPSFILFGDSLTQKSFGEGGWGARLADAYQRKVRQQNTIWAPVPDLDAQNAPPMIPLCDM